MRTGHRLIGGGAAAVLAVAALTACSADDPTPSTSATAVAPAPAPSSAQQASADPAPSSAAAAPESPEAEPTEMYNGWEATRFTLTEPADIAQLPAAFADFATVVEQALADPECELTDVSVERIHPDGFIVGNVLTSCRSAPGVFTRVDGQWARVVEMDGIVMCEDFARIGMPRGLRYPCATSADGSEQMPY